MNTSPATRPFTLEDITRRKLATQKEIAQQKALLARLGKDVAAPFMPSSKTNGMFRAFNTGMAVLEGITVGIKLMRRFRKLFR